MYHFNQASVISTPPGTCCVHQKSTRAVPELCRCWS